MPGIIVEHHEVRMFDAHFRARAPAVAREHI
jgi:hypothetical protein